MIIFKFVCSIVPGNATFGFQNADYDYKSGQRWKTFSKKRTKMLTKLWKSCVLETSSLRGGDNMLGEKLENILTRHQVI